MTTQAEIGARIRQARERINLSQEEFAVTVGKDQRAISEYENDKRKLAAFELTEFARVLIVPVSFFFDAEIVLDELEQLMVQEMRRIPTTNARQAAIKIVRVFAEMLRESNTQP